MTEFIKPKRTLTTDPMELPTMIKSSTAMAMLDIWVRMAGECDEAEHSLSELCPDNTDKLTHDMVAAAVRLQSSYEATVSLGEKLLSLVDTLVADGYGHVFTAIDADTEIIKCKKLIDKCRAVDVTVTLPEKRMNIVLAGKLSKLLCVHRLVRERHEAYYDLMELGGYIGDSTKKLRPNDAKIAYAALSDLRITIAHLALPLVHTHLTELLACIDESEHEEIRKEIEHCHISVSNPDTNAMIENCKEAERAQLN